MKKEDFVKITSNWGSHRPLLWEALEATSGLVVEFGMGDNSTPFLEEYCRARARELRSFDNNEEWFNKMRPRFPHEMTLVKNWDFVQGLWPDVLLIDHAPGERRRVDLYRFSKTAQIIVAHDTEPAADHGYKMRAELAEFKYQIDYETDGAWATAVSNFIDVTQWKENLNR